jgi:ABC-type transport system involved in cytochrome bd biosynthesis fused ATPase/permease subunit
MADLIVVLDGARIVEVGSHQELVAKGGAYAELYGIQAAAYRDQNRKGATEGKQADRDDG